MKADFNLIPVLMISDFAFYRFFMTALKKEWSCDILRFVWCCLVGCGLFFCCGVFFGGDCCCFFKMPREGKKITKADYLSAWAFHEKPMEVVTFLEDLMPTPVQEEMNMVFLY